MEPHELKLVRMKRAANALFSDIKAMTFPAERIILFGSFAKDCIHERSDMDICLVSDEELTVKQQREMERYFHDMSQDEFSLDFVYCDNNKLKNGSQVFESIRRDGRVLYERV